MIHRLSQAALSPYSTNLFRWPLPGEWESKVDFVFSVPTTRKSQHVFDTYRQCIQDAGFGKKGKRHKFYIGLTEAEAAAIHTFSSQALKFKVSQSSFCRSPLSTNSEKRQTRDIILVCDVGGGTTVN